MLQKQAGGASEAPHNVLGRIGRNIFCAALLALASGFGGQEAEAQNRPAGAPTITAIHSFAQGGVWITYAPPTDLGEPPATGPGEPEATGPRMRARRVGHTTWANPSGANGHIRWVNEQNVVTPTADGHLWTWTHGNNGGEIVTYGPGSRWGAGSAWEVQIAYTNGQVPVAWSPARTVIVGAPREPREVALTAGPGAFRVTWLRDNSGGNTPVETGWKVQYRKSGATTWTDADISDADARSHVQTGLDSETAYEVQVAGTNARGTGTVPATPYTVTTLAGTLTSPSVPKSPRNLSATQSGNSLAVTWDAPASGDTPTAYQVRWRIGLDTRRRGVAEWSTPVQVTQRTHTIAGISDSVLYEVQVASISNTLLSFPAFITWDTTLSGPTITQVEKPVNLAATQSSNSLNVTWDAPTSGAVVTKYQIRWRTGKTKGQRAAAAWSSPVTVTGGQATGNTHTIPGISNAVFYQVEIASVTDQLITFPEFIKWEARVGGPRITTPQIPTNLTATHGNGALTLNWGPPTRGATVGTYRVRWRSGATKAARNAATWSTPVQVENATHYAIPNIADDRTTLYQAQVASITDDLLAFPGLIDWRTTVQWPEITVPEPPQNLRVTHSVDTLTLAWEPPASGATVMTYRVRYKTGSTEALLATAGWSAPVQTTTRSQSISGIVTGTFFEAQIASINDDILAFPDFIEWEATVGWPSRPAGAPFVSVVPRHASGVGFLEISYSRPGFLGVPPAEEVRIRHRSPNGTWSSNGGEEGQARPDSHTVFAGGIWTWSHRNNGGTLLSLPVASGHTWEIEMAYANGRTQPKWSKVRTATGGTPAEVTGVEVVAGPGAFQISWRGTVGDTGLGFVFNPTGWEVLYRKKGESDYTSVEIADPSARAYVQNGLEPGAEYEVMVAGTTAPGTGVLPASPRTVTISATDAVTPRNLAATRGDGEVTLAWDAPASGGPYSTYKVRVKTGADEAALDAAEYGDPVAVGELTHTITVANDELYAAQVAAINDSAPEFVSWDATAQSAAPKFAGAAQESADAAFELPVFYVRANPYSVQLPAATNPDSTPINYTLAGLPAGTGMEFAADTRILSGTPTADAVAAGGGVLTYTATDATALSVEQTFLLAFGEFDMDVDESGTVDSRDSILVARYLLGVTGAALTFGQTGAATEDVADKIAAGKADASGHLDVDGDNDTDADDGILITRYMFGLRGAALVAGIGDLEESDASGIEAKIAALPSP